MVKIVLSLAMIMLSGVFFAASAKDITDVLNRDVVVPDNVERIVALGSSMTFVSYLGAQDVVVGVEDFDKKDNFTKPYIYLNREIVKDLPVVAKGGPGRSVNLEALISLRPDVVFLNTLDKNEPDLLQKKLRIPVVTLGYGLPSFEFETYYRSIKVAGEVLNKQARAEEIVKYTEELISELSDAGEFEKEAYIGGISFKGFHGIDSTSADFMPFKLAKIKNVSDVTGKKGQVFVSKEFVLSINPNIIFIDGNGIQLIKDDFAKNKAFYSRLSAFREGNVFLCLPDTSYFVNPEVMLANAFAMAKEAYPERFGSVNPEEKADEIFKFFYGRPLYSYFEEDCGGYRRIKMSEENLTFEKIYAQ